MTKTGKPRQIRLHIATLTLLRKLADHDTPKPQDRVFGYANRWSVNQAIRRACQRVQIPVLSSHRVGRHAFAARLLKDGASLLDVLRAGGWSSLRMLQDHYGHLEHSRIDHVVTHATNVLDHGPLIDVTPNTKEDPS